MIENPEWGMLESSILHMGGYWMGFPVFRIGYGCMVAGALVNTCYVRMEGRKI